MRILLIYCLLFFMAIDCNGQNKKEDELLFLNKNHVFGTIQRDTLVKARFYFMYSFGKSKTNRIIQDIQSMACSRYQISTSPPLILT